MSLRNDVKFVTSLIGRALRQILGETFRNLADYLLHEGNSIEVQPEVSKVKVAPAPVQTTPRKKNSPKSQSRIEVTPIETNPESSPGGDLSETLVKVRDRSTYNPKDHNGYKIAAIGILRTLLNTGSRFSAPALHKIHQNVSDSTIRTACKTMVTDGLLATELDKGLNSAVYWILDHEAARLHLMDLEATTPALPVSNERGES